MSDKASRASGVPSILIGVGLLLTVVLFSPIRPWGIGPNPLNRLLLLGPILLAAGAASAASRPRETGATAAQPRPEKGGSAAGVVLGSGLVMLLIGGCPWLYTPLFFGGESNSSSGMLGTIIFLLIGLPGLTITAIGLVNTLAHRRARVAPETHPVTKADGDDSGQAGAEAR